MKYARIALVLIALMVLMLAFSAESQIEQTVFVSRPHPILTQQVQLTWIQIGATYRAPF